MGHYVVGGMGYNGSRYGRCVYRFGGWEEVTGVLLMRSRIGVTSFVRQNLGRFKRSISITGSNSTK